MRHIVQICPDCGDSMVATLKDGPTVFGQFISKCGTVVRFEVDSRASNVMARVTIHTKEANNERK